MEYLKFQIKVLEKEKQSIFKKSILFIFKKLLPIANPDYEDEIPFVTVWLLEFEDFKSIPIREIGLNRKGEVILKMPYKSNYGYWCDNILVYQDFKKQFEIEHIDEFQFASYWEQI